MSLSKRPKPAATTRGNDQRSLILFLVIPLAGLIALLIPSPIVGHDSWLHLIWIEQFAGLVKEGVLYPRWLHLSNGGFGSPTFYFYPPLAAYLGSLYSVINSSAQELDLFRFVAYIGTLGSIVSFRYYLNTLNVESKLAWAGGMLYAILPYRAVDLVLRNALGEHLAFVWIPFVLVGTERMCAPELKQRVRGFLIASVSFALLVLSNIPCAIVIGIAVPIYTLIRHDRTWRVALISIAQLVAGALLASFYLLPAMILRGNIQSWHLWDAGTSRDGAAFTITDVIRNASSALTNANLVMLLAGILALVLAYSVIRQKLATPQHRILAAWSALALLAVIMQIPELATIAYQQRWLGYLQFSWRWNLLLVPAIVTVFVQLYQTRQVVVLLSTAVLAITTIWVVTGFNSRYQHHQSPDVLKIEYSDAFEYIPATATLGTHAIANFVGKHRTDPAVLLSAPGTAELIQRTGDTREYTFDLPQPATATFHHLAWPVWELEVDGKVVETSVDDLGRMTSMMPAGKHRVAIKRRTDQSERIGGWISLVALGGVAAMVIWGRGKSKGR